MRQYKVSSLVSTTRAPKSELIHHENANVVPLKRYECIRVLLRKKSFYFSTFTF